MSVESLAAGACQGCKESFAELYQRFHPRLVQFLLPRVASHVDAEDIAQESLTKAWKSIKSFDPRFQFSTWLYTIATRTCVDFLRKAKTTTTPIGEWIQDPSQAGAATVQQADEVANIWRIASLVLTKEQFSVMWLRFGEELPVKDVAKVLRKTQVGVRVLLHRGKAALIPHLVDEGVAGIKQEGAKTSVTRKENPAADSGKVGEA